MMKQIESDENYVGKPKMELKKLLLLFWVKDTGHVHSQPKEISRI